jgi:hypothetical protein
MVGAACTEARVIKTTASSRPPQAAKRKLKAMKTSSILCAIVAVSFDLWQDNVVEFVNGRYCVSLKIVSRLSRLTRWSLRNGCHNGSDRRRENERGSVETTTKTMRSQDRTYNEGRK